MEATIRIEDLLRGLGASPSRTRADGAARLGRRPREALLAGILDAALTRDLAALRAYGARMAEELSPAELDPSELTFASTFD